MCPNYYFLRTVRACLDVFFEKANVGFMLLEP